jgi:serine/threonine-protein kinase
MDFGIARAMADNGMTMTQTAAVIGTAQYLSPEQAKGETVDARSDLYSTGCLMYELLTGRPPFVGDSPVAVAYQHVREEPQPPSSYDPEVTPAIDAVVLKSLAKSADQRYQSATEMRADIERVLDGRPTEAQTAVLGAANMPTQRLDPRQVGAAAAIGQTRAMPAVEVPTSYQPAATPRYDEEFGDGPGTRPPAPPRRAEPRRPPEPEKSGKAGYIILAVAGIAAVIAAILLAKSLLKSGGNANSKAVPDFGIGQTNVTKAQQILAQPEYAGFSLGAQVCPNGTDVHSQAAGTIIAQDPAAGTFTKPGPITYCLSQGPQKGKVPTKAALNGMNSDQLKSYLAGAHFNVDNPLITSQPDPKVPVNNVIDVVDTGNNNAILDGKQIDDVTKVTIGWIVSTGPSKIPLPNNYGGQPVDQVINQIKGLGFTNVTKAQDPSANGQPANTVTKISPGDGGSYPADTPVVVYYAPQPPPSTPSSTQQQCDPQDPNCQQGGPSTPSTGPDNSQSSGNGNPACTIYPQLCPSSPSTSKKGGGGNN